MMESDGSSRSYGIGEEEPITTVTAVPVFGKSRTFAGLDWKEWMFLLVSLLNLAISVALTIYRLYEVIAVEKNTNSADFTFPILLLVNAGFCLFYVLHGLLREREFELYAFIAAIIVVVGYCIIEYISQGHLENDRDIKLARLICVCVLAPINIVLALVVAYQFGWLEFRIVGASEALQYMYRETTRYSCLLKFDFQISVSLIVLVLRDGATVGTAELVTLFVGIPYSFMWMVVGHYCMLQEKMHLVYTVVLLGLASPGYVIYKLFFLYHEYYYEDVDFTSSDMTLFYSTLAACAMALVVHTMVFVELFRVTKNFGKGLKERLFNRELSERTSLLSGARL